ncbi:unnamed protein product, partial [Ilex paraguariensis]
LLLAPVRLGGQAISWAAGKLETSRNGLPISPSSSDVQSRCCRLLQSMNLNNLILRKTKKHLLN